jgi:hypothetical protein
VVVSIVELRLALLYSIEILWVVELRPHQQQPTLIAFGPSDCDLFWRRIDWRAAPSATALSAA